MRGIKTCPFAPVEHVTLDALVPANQCHHPPTRTATKNLNELAYGDKQKLLELLCFEATIYKLEARSADSR